MVLTTKHHDGFTLWPSSTPNPKLPADRQHATRDIVGDLTTAVNQQGLRMGLYYSGGYDWTFVPGPIRTAADYQSVKPQSEAYGKYADAQFRELIERYHPAVLWNDIDYPKSGHPLELMAEYYNAVPDGVIDDRFGVKHSDFKSPEYKVLDKISPTKWEECRGLGRSFGYNRAEGEAETIAPDELIYLLVDIVSKNGNLLLDVGPEADGTIPPVQMRRLQALGAWLKQNGEAIYGTHPWKTAEGDDLRRYSSAFHSKGFRGVRHAAGQTKDEHHHSEIARTQGRYADLSPGRGRSRWRGLNRAPIPESRFRTTLPGQYAYVLKIAGPVSMAAANPAGPELKPR